MAREHPRYASMEFPDYEYREYPMMVYPGAPDQKKPYDPKTGKPLKGVLVENDEEYARVMAKDAELVPTISPGVQRVQTAEDEKEALLVRAAQLGVQVDKRWGIAKIQDAIDNHEREVL
jgi:hypothetical protein